MDKYLPEKNLDKILEGKLSPDELGNFWQWLRVRMAAATTNLDEHYNMYYLQHMREVFFESCKKFENYQKFYVDNLWNYDGKALKERWLQEEEDINFYKPADEKANQED